MIIIRDEIYLNELDSILKYMSQNNQASAIRFLDALDSKINNLVNMPFKFRHSHYYHDTNVRDLVFRGYTIPYLVDKNRNIIVILDIFKWQYRDVVL